MKLRRSLLAAPVLVLVLGTFLGVRALGRPAMVGGTLRMRHGIAALECDGGIYYAPRLEPYLGMIEGLDEGRVLSLEGPAWGGGAFRCIWPRRLTLNGRVYELSGKDGVRVSHRLWNGRDMCCP